MAGRNRAERSEQAGAAAQPVRRTWREIRVELDFDAADEAAIAEHRHRLDPATER